MPQPAPPPAAAPTVGITDLWPTTVWTGSASTDAVAALHGPHPAVALDRLARTAGVDTAGASWHVDVEHWPSGHFAALRHGPGLWRAVIVLDASTRADNSTPPVGVLVPDPRAGAAASFVPGLPWGRPLPITATPGSAALFPGWCGWHIPPADTPRTLCVAYTVAPAAGTTCAPGRAGHLAETA